MRRYETIIIIDPDVSEEKHATILDKVAQLLDQSGGLLVEIDNWGLKRIAYEIKEKIRGHYIRFDFCAEVEVIRELEYFFRINDNVMKFITIVLEKKINLEAIKIALAESKQSEIKEEEEDTKSKNQDQENGAEVSTNTLENENSITDKEE